MTTITKYGPNDAGCYMDSARGIYMSADIVEFAEAHGFTPSDEVQAMDYQQRVDDEWIHDEADNAIEWLNENVCADGVTFGLFEGELFLATADDWETTFA